MKKEKKIQVLFLQDFESKGAPFFIKKERENLTQSRGTYGAKSFEFKPHKLEIVPTQDSETECSYAAVNETEYYFILNGGESPTFSLEVLFVED